MSNQTSKAREAANRQNAQKSTGPKTEAGKANSRKNSLKHGLSGGQTVLPPELEAELPARIAEVIDHAGLRSNFDHHLVRRVALHSLRLEAIEREQARSLHEYRESKRPENLPIPPDLAATYLDHLRRHSAQAMIDLPKTPEGLAWLKQLIDNLEALLHAPQPTWDLTHLVLLSCLLSHDNLWRSLPHDPTLQTLKQATDSLDTGTNTPNPMSREDAITYIENALDDVREHLGLPLPGTEEEEEQTQEAPPPEQEDPLPWVDLSPTGVKLARYEKEAESALYRGLRELRQKPAADTPKNPNSNPENNIQQELAPQNPPPRNEPNSPPRNHTPHPRNTPRPPHQNPQKPIPHPTHPRR